MTRVDIAQLAQSGATNGQLVSWNGTRWIPAGSVSTPCRAAFTAAGGERVLSVGIAPASNTEQVFVNGLAKRWAVDYTLVGSTITLTTPLSAGDVLLLLYGTTTGSCGISSIAPLPRGFVRPKPLARPVRRFHRIR